MIGLSSVPLCMLESQITALTLAIERVSDPPSTLSVFGNFPNGRAIVDAAKQKVEAIRKTAVQFARVSGQVEKLLTIDLATAPGKCEYFETLRKLGGESISAMAVELRLSLKLHNVFLNHVFPEAWLVMAATEADPAFSAAKWFLDALEIGATPDSFGEWLGDAAETVQTACTSARSILKDMKDYPAAAFAGSSLAPSDCLRRRGLSKLSCRRPPVLGLSWVSAYS